MSRDFEDLESVNGIARPAKAPQLAGREDIDMGVSREDQIARVPNAPASPNSKATCGPTITLVILGESNIDTNNAVRHLLPCGFGNKVPLRGVLKRSYQSLETLRRDCKGQPLACLVFFSVGYRGSFERVFNTV